MSESGSQGTQYDSKDTLEEVMYDTGIGRDKEATRRCGLTVREK